MVNRRSDRARRHDRGTNHFRHEKAAARDTEPGASTKRFHPPLAIATWRGRKVAHAHCARRKSRRDKQRSFEGLDCRARSYVAFIESTRGTDVSLYRFQHPFLGSLNMYDWFRMIGHHELRHAKQIRELVETFHH